MVEVIESMFGSRTNFSTLDDIVLIEMIAGARSEALAALYDRYGRLVFTIACRVVGDPETAEEITQDVFVRVWEGASTYRPDMAKVSSWLISITRHRSIDELRRRGARPEKGSMALLEDLGIEGAEGMPSLNGPEDAVENTLQNRSIRQAIASLPPEQRNVLNLAFFMGLSHSQIAETMGEPLGTIKSRIRLAMHRLREAIIERGVIDS